MLPLRHALAHSAFLAVGLVAATACSSSRVVEPATLDGGGVDLLVRDAGRSRDEGIDFARDAAPFDGGPRVACDAQDANEELCPAYLCDGLDRWYWNGDRCFSIPCGACRGTDCEAGLSSQTECETLHSECEPTLCRATGGDWLFWAQECLPYRCGLAVPADCAFGRPVCDCGPRSVFEPGLGCVLDAGCMIEPPMPTRELLCTGTFGTWENICCDTVCGAFCPLACASLACNCGAGRVFDDARGCIEATRCFERGLGETCNDPRARCATGTLCCQSCGGAGCFGDATCRAPTCTADPAIDLCGNNLWAP